MKFSELPETVQEDIRSEAVSRKILAQRELQESGRPSLVHKPELRNVDHPLNTGQWYCVYQGWRFPPACSPEGAMRTFDETWHNGFPAPRIEGPTENQPTAFRHLLLACLAWFDDMKEQEGGARFVPDERWLKPIRKAVLGG